MSIRNELLLTEGEMSTGRPGLVIAVFAAYVASLASILMGSILDIITSADAAPVWLEAVILAAFAGVFLAPASAGVFVHRRSRHPRRPLILGDILVVSGPVCFAALIGLALSKGGTVADATTAWATALVLTAGLGAGIAAAVASRKPALTVSGSEVGDD